MSEESAPLRIVVVGASSGLGRSIGTHLGGRGMRVALLARREDRLADAVKDAGKDAFAVRCDVTEESSCRDAVTSAGERLGGIDGLIYASGIGVLGRLDELDATQWRRTFDTNVIGAALATAAALPFLKESSGVAAYLSSVQSGLTPPWPGLGSYAVSKTALDKLVEAWRQENPSVGFTSVVIGDCAGGEGQNGVEFATGWDPELAGGFYPIWMQRNYMNGSLMKVDELLKVIEAVMRVGASASIPTVSVVPRPPASA